MKPSFLSDNRFEDATPTASSTASGYDPANVADRRPYTQWVADSTASTIMINCGVAKSADTLAIAGHNLGTIAASVVLEASANGTDWATVLPSFLPAGDLVIMKPFAAASYQYWRLSISAGAAAQIGVLSVGTRISPARFPAGAFAPENITVKSDNAIGKTGHLLGSAIRYLPKAIAATLQHPGKAWVEDIYKPFFIANAGKPFFFGWDLDNWPEKCGMYRFDGNYAPVYDPLGRVTKLPIKLIGVHA
jgi:hypothetical protein